MNNKKMQFAFTLVELVVVVTIVSILSTIGFVAYTDYLKGVRDGNRLQQISEIYKAMELYATRTQLPFPDDSISVVAGSTQIGYQGYAGKSVLDTIRYSDGGTDPQTKQYFTYFVSADRKLSQILGYYEEQKTQSLSYNSSLYADYDTLYPRVFGVGLGLLVDTASQAPVQEIDSIKSNAKIDILSYTGSLTSFISDNEIVTGSGQGLIGMIPNTSCKSLLDIYGYNTTGIYKINPTGAEIINVFCDMTTDGGGWTMIMRHASPVGGYTGNFGWKTQVGSIQDTSTPYSLGLSVFSIRFNELMFSSMPPYVETKDDFIFTYQVPSSELQTLTTSLKTYSSCKTIKALDKNDPGTTGPTSCNQITQFGKVDLTTGYQTGGRVSGYQGFNVGTQFWNNMNGIEGMIFIR